MLEMFSCKDLIIGLTIESDKCNGLLKTFEKRPIWVILSKTLIFHLFWQREYQSNSSDSLQEVAIKLTFNLS